MTVLPTNKIVDDPRISPRDVVLCKMWGKYLIRHNDPQRADFVTHLIVEHVRST